MSDDLVTTTLSDFTESDGADTARDEQSASLDNCRDNLAHDVERNAADIEHLIDIVNSVSDQVNTLVENVQQEPDTSGGIVPPSESHDHGLSRGYY